MLLSYIYFIILLRNYFVVIYIP